MVDRYRVTNNIILPFRIIPAVQEESQTRMSISLKVTATFGPTKSASNVVIKIPVRQFLRILEFLGG